MISGSYFLLRYITQGVFSIKVAQQQWVRIVFEMVSYQALYTLSMICTSDLHSRYGKDTDKIK